MPLSVHKKGNEYCVEEPGGKSLGCHDTQEKADKQMAAINASKHAKRDMGEEDERRAVFTQESVDYVPLSGQAGQACANCVFYHARDDYDLCAIVQDWPHAIQNTGWCNRWEVSPILTPPMQEEIDLEAEEMLMEERQVDKPGLRERISQFFTPKPDGSMWDNPIGFRMLNDGKWMGWYSNNFRDYYGTIFSEQGFDDYIYRLESGLIPMPELRALHVRGTEHGQADRVFRAGHFIIAVGHFDDDTEHEQAYYRANQHRLGMSHGFNYDPEQFIDGVFYAFNTFEVSTLPQEFAGNPYTYFMEVRSMSTVLAPEVRTFLVDLMGEEKVTGLEQTAQERGMALEQSGAQYRNFTTRSEADLVAQIAQLNERLAAMEQTAQNVAPVETSEPDTSATDELSEAIRALTERVNTMDTFLKDKFRTQPRASQSVQTILEANDPKYQQLRETSDKVQASPSYVDQLQRAYRGNADVFEQFDLMGGPPMVPPPAIPVNPEGQS